MSGVRAGRVKKSRKSPRAQTRSVLRMMAIMQDNNKESMPEKEFLETGRTGRRNAMHDILQPAGAVVTTADLPSRLSKLATSDIPHPGPSKTDLEVKKDENPTSKEECS